MAASVYLETKQQPNYLCRPHIKCGKVWSGTKDPLNQQSQLKLLGRDVDTNGNKQAMNLLNVTHTAYHSNSTHTLHYDDNYG